MSKTISYFKNRYIFKGSFATNVLTLMTGTTIAQLILLAASPVLTRIYIPKDFGIYTLYISMASLIAILSTGRYELAVMLPDNDEDAINIVGLIIMLSFLISLVALIILWIFNVPIAKMLGILEVSIWLYLVPLMVFLTGIYQAFYYWLNRKKQYKRLAENKIIQAVLTAGISVAMGATGLGVTGLVVGATLGQVIATGIIGWQAWKENKGMIALLRYYKIKKQIGRYQRFPLYCLPADFLNVASNQAPAVLLSSFFGPIVTGFFGLTQRVLGTPVSLISTSVFDVFKERASSDYRKDGNCRDIYIKTFKGLFLLSIIPFMIFFFTAPKLFSIIFGKNWIVAGEYAQILSLMFFFRFTCSPLTYVLYIAQKQNYDLVWQIALFIAIISSIITGAYWNSAKVSMICLSLSYSIMYIIYFLLSYHFAKGNTICQRRKVFS
jgi:O-antigen/teichoic acid export membrane protein